ncbi:hypothetical protein Q7P37_010003 [Cladosporium fusiforme]
MKALWHFTAALTMCNCSSAEVVLARSLHLIYLTHTHLTPYRSLRSRKRNPIDLYYIVGVRFVNAQWFGRLTKTIEPERPFSHTTTLESPTKCSMADEIFTPSNKRRRLDTVQSDRDRDIVVIDLTSESGDIKDGSAGGTVPVDMPVLPDTPMSEQTLQAEFEPHSEGRKLSHVQIPRPSLPNVAFTSWEPSGEVRSESTALTESQYTGGFFKTEEGSQYLELENYSIYRKPDGFRAMDLCTLDRLQAGRGVDSLCFSGTLSNGRAKVAVKDVEFSTLAIDGYGDNDCNTMSDKICIQSRRASLHNVWYRLGRPSTEYIGFFKPFLWLATFTKFFVDFLIAKQDASITLSLFRSTFTPWLIMQYGSYSYFQSWHRECGLQKDFGTSVAAFALFLYKECYSIDDPQSRLLQQPIWHEIDPLNLKAIKRQPLDDDMRTVVTPFVYRCFQDMYFASHLRLRKPHLEVLERIAALKKQRCLTPWDAESTARPDIDIVQQASDQQPSDDIHQNTDPSTESGPDPPSSQPLIDVQQGDVVCVEPNAERDWKDSKSTIWYAYVQAAYQDQSGNKKLDVIWLYEPSDTTIGDGFYPFKNELFFSDNCSCGRDAIPLETAVAKLDISWFVSDPGSIAGYFVRQKFHTSESDDSYAFTTLKSEDLGCSDNHLTSFEAFLKRYKAGQTVLMHPYGRDELLRPMRILSIDLDMRKVLLRKLLRTSDPKAPPNELYESTAKSDILLPFHRIVRHCRVGRFASRTQVQSPYNHHGAGDHFYILEEDNFSSQSTLATPPESDDGNEANAKARTTQKRPLVGLDLFCGGGNFGRGLEESGVVKMQYAVDWDVAALHSYRANVVEPESVQYFLGSVNGYLRRALNGSKNDLIASVGKPEFISAGSPCPGFSNMQPDKQSHQSLQFASMVASVVAFVDCYSPQYFVLENVVSMTSTMLVHGHKQNVFSQIISSLVALGYQVQQFLGDAWSVGSSQHRSRVFIVASAPGTSPLLPPPCTHGHHKGKMIAKSLGKTSNGLPFGIRRFEPAPFPGASTRAATSDLPDISDSQPQICPRFPDHRTFADQGLATRERLARVPIHPRGMGLQQAVHTGEVTSGEAYEWAMNCKGHRGKKESRSYTRVHPEGLFPTIMTALHPQCAFNGTVIHWDQHRPLSILETKRAQGFLDYEVIVGVPSQQLKIVGNSVDRKVAFALGLVLKDSWETTLKQKRDDLMDDEQATIPTFEQPSDLEVPDSKPLPTLTRSDREQYEVERSRKFKQILRNLIEHNKPAGSEDMERGQRWSGDSPADAAKVRRQMLELEFYLRSE